MGPRVFYHITSLPFSCRVMVTLVLSSGADYLLAFAHRLVHVWLIIFALRWSNISSIRTIIFSFYLATKVVASFSDLKYFCCKTLVWFFYQKYFHFCCPEKNYRLSSGLSFSQENVPCVSAWCKIRSFFCHSRSVPLCVPNSSRADSLKQMEVRTDSSMSFCPKLYDFPFPPPDASQGRGCARTRVGGKMKESLTGSFVEERDSEGWLWGLAGHARCSAAEPRTAPFGADGRRGWARHGRCLPGPPGGAGATGGQCGGARGARGARRGGHKIRGRPGYSTLGLSPEGAWGRGAGVQLLVAPVRVTVSGVAGCWRRGSAERGCCGRCCGWPWCAPITWTWVAPWFSGVPMAPSLGTRCCSTTMTARGGE